MTKAFYSRSAMGANFERNPVIPIQRAQFDLVDPSEFGRKPIRVLDLGCGGGTPTRLLSPDAFEVIGADLSVEAIRLYQATSGRSALQVDAQELPFADDSFEVVVSDDVVEHLVDTDSYAREIRRVLAPNGWLFLSTPNLAAWFNRIGLVAGLQPAFTEVSFERVFGRPGEDIVGHLRVFTSRSICEFLRFHQFRIVDVRGARFDALPRALHGVDGLMARIRSLAGNTVIAARAVG